MEVPSRSKVKNVVYVNIHIETICIYIDIILMKRKNRINKLLKEKDMTQEELALRIGLSQPEISRIAAGKREDLTLRNAAKIAMELGESIEYVFPDYFTR